LIRPGELLLEFLGSLPDLRLDPFLLLRRAQTPDGALGSLCCPSIVIDFVQEGRVKLPLCVDRCRGPPSLSTNGALFRISLSWERSARRRDPTPLINRWRKSQNGSLIFFPLISGGLWLRWHLGVSFSFVSVVGVGLVTTERSLKVVSFVVFFEDGDKVVEVEELLSVVVLVGVIENSVANDILKRTGLSNVKRLTVFD
jgi:hypothetical protein